MKIIFDQDHEEEFLEIVLTEREIKDMLSYHAMESRQTIKKKKPLNIFIRRASYATSQGILEESDQQEH